MSILKGARACKPICGHDGRSGGLARRSRIEELLAEDFLGCRYLLRARHHLARRDVDHGGPFRLRLAAHDLRLPLQLLARPPPQCSRPRPRGAPSTPGTAVRGVKLHDPRASPERGASSQDAAHRRQDLRAVDQGVAIPSVVSDHERVLALVVRAGRPRADGRRDRLSGDAWLPARSGAPRAVGAYGESRGSGRVVSSPAPSPRSSRSRTRRPARAR